MKRNILLLTHRVPYPPDRGDRIRSWQILRRLAERVNVYLAAPTDETVTPAALSKLNELCADVHIAPQEHTPRWRRALRALAKGHAISDACFYEPQLAQTIAEWATRVRFDGAVAYCSSMAQYLTTPPWNEIPCLVDLVDIDSRKWSDYAGQTWGAQRIIYAREARLVRRSERQVVDRASRVTVTTSAEARLLRDDCPHSQPLVMSNGVDPVAPSVAASHSIPGRVAFIGVLDYFPNVAGITWFVREVWPQVRRTHANATLTIVGRKPAGEVLRLARVPGVTIHANVPAVQPFLADAELVIAPLPIARGIQNKVLEAMAMRRAVVASPAVCNGIDAQAGHELVCAGSADQWNAAVVELLRDEHQRQRLAAAGERFVTRHHNWQQTLAPLDDWLDGLAPVEIAMKPTTVLQQA